MMRLYKTDLHIHSCLSPCAELEMSPRNIVHAAEKIGLDIIGICDHNSCENVQYVQKLVESRNLSVTGGIEITSREEVHILAFFEKKEELFSMQQIIYDNLQTINDDKVYGDQVVVNEKDEVVGFNHRLLIGATELSVEQIVEKIHELNGIAIASHIDRDSFSILSQLGFVPEGISIDAYEVSRKEQSETYADRYSPLVTFSDSHNLDTIGKGYTNFCMERASVEEIGKALVGEDGRKVFI